jgi:hypothetical protein
VVKALQDQAAQIIMAQQNIFPASKPMVGAAGTTRRMQRLLLPPLMDCKCIGAVPSHDPVNLAVAVCSIGVTKSSLNVLICWQGA